MLKTKDIHRPIKWHLTQKRFHLNRSLYRGFTGGRGSGKSYAGALDLLLRSEPGRTYQVVSPTYGMLEDTTLPTFLTVAKEKGLYRGLKMSPHPNVRLAKGRVVRFRSAEEPDKLRGPNLSGIWLDEASLMSDAAYLISIASLREKGQMGWLSATFTPVGKLHWTFKTFGTSAPDTALFQCRTRDNPFNPPEFEDTLRRQYPSSVVEQELGGQFIDPIGALYKREWFRHRYMDFGDKFMCGGRYWPKSLIQVYITCDPAASEKETADYTWIGVWARTEDNYLLLLDVDRRQMGVEAIVPSIMKLVNLWSPEWVAVEATGFQVGIVNNARRTSGMPPVRELQPDGRGKLSRSYPAIVLAESGRLLLPAKEPLWVGPYLDELTQWTGDMHEIDDAVDGTSYAVLQMPRHGMDDRPSEEACPQCGTGRLAQERSSRAESAAGVSMPLRCQSCGWVKPMPNRTIRGGQSDASKSGLWGRR